MCHSLYPTKNNTSSIFVSFSFSLIFFKYLFFLFFILEPAFHTCSLLAHHGNDMSGCMEPMPQYVCILSSENELSESALHDPSRSGPEIDGGPGLGGIW